MNGYREHDSNFKNIYFSRIKDPALMIEGKGMKNMHSSTLKNREQIRKNKKLAGKNGEAYFISLSK